MQAVSSNHQGWEEIDDKERNNLFAAGKNGLSDSEAVVKEVLCMYLFFWLPY